MSTGEEAGKCSKAVASSSKGKRSSQGINDRDSSSTPSKKTPPKKESKQSSVLQQLAADAGKEDLHVKSNEKEEKSSEKDKKEKKKNKKD